jgi:hypothetical protein
MSAALSTTSGGTPATTGGSALAAPDGTGAAGATNLALARMAVLLDQARKAIQLLDEVGTDLLATAAAVEDVGNALGASTGERVSLEEIRVIARMLNEIADGSLALVARGHESTHAAFLANFQVLAAQEALHSLGADGAYVDSQRRAG